ncbi:unnamed protein product, partial [Allacma fusca]
MVTIVSAGTTFDTLYLDFIKNVQKVAKSEECVGEKIDGTNSFKKVEDGCKNKNKSQVEG